MANNEPSIDVNMNLTVDEKTLGRALNIVEMWLEDHPDKTIVIEQEAYLRVCLIADAARTGENNECDQKGHRKHTAAGRIV